MDRLYRLIGQPVGISLRNGRGISGVLCDVRGNYIYVLEYLYAQQFATFKYRFDEIQNIYRFPSCRSRRSGYLEQ
jgi:NurA-like 5'-3' nuclease